MRYPNTAVLRLQPAAILADQGKKTEVPALVDALLAERPNNLEAQRLKQALTAK